MSYSVLGSVCPPCAIPVGEGCVPCPPGASDPECQGCVGSRLADPGGSWLEHPFWGPVVISAATAVVGGVALVLANRVGIRTMP
jgi:hypothetical protein